MQPGSSRPGCSEVALASLHMGEQTLLSQEMRTIQWKHPAYWAEVDIHAWGMKL
jgi:hypothetical protein